LPVHSERSQEDSDLSLPQFARVPATAERDEAAYPRHVRAFGTLAIVTGANRGSHRLKQRWAQRAGEHW
jgi:hypothetical protein